MQVRRACIIFALVLQPRFSRGCLVCIERAAMKGAIFDSTVE